MHLGRRSDPDPVQQRLLVAEEATPPARAAPAPASGLSTLPSRTMLPSTVVTATRLPGSSCSIAWRRPGQIVLNEDLVRKSSSSFSSTAYRLVGRRDGRTDRRWSATAACTSAISGSATNTVAAARACGHLALAHLELMLLLVPMVSGCGRPPAGLRAARPAGCPEGEDLARRSAAAVAGPAAATVSSHQFDPARPRRLRCWRRAARGAARTAGRCAAPCETSRSQVSSAAATRPRTISASRRRARLRRLSDSLPSSVRRATFSAWPGRDLEGRGLGALVGLALLGVIAGRRRPWR